MNQTAETSSLFSVVRAREAGLGGKQGTNDASAMWLDAIFNVSSWQIVLQKSPTEGVSTC